MKQIFDWLREQFGKIIGEVHSPADTVWNNAVKMCIAKVDEAEAKWESECCTWKKNIYFFGGHDYSSGCGTRIPLNSLEYHKYCPFCGKRIKISEVE